MPVKISPNSNYGIISGKIHFGDLLLKRAVKLVEVYDAKLRKKDYQWISGETFEFSKLKPGIYGLKLVFTTGAAHYETTEVYRQKTSFVEFSLVNEYNIQYDDRQYIQKTDIDGYLLQYRESIPLTEFRFNVSLLVYDGYQWITRFLKNFVMGSSWSDDVNYQFETTSGLQLLIIEHELFASKLIRLPPNSRLYFNFQEGQSFKENAFPIDVRLTTDNWKAESLLGLLQSGSMAKAKSLFNAVDAEDLLYTKRDDHSAAAVGGYYLLKTRELERIHNWAANLCNWFPELPDGAIIYAWQLISAGKEGNTPEITRQVRELLLMAVGRGIPVYTEGMRLLYDGLKQLSSLADKQDKEIEAALRITRFYVAHIDWSQGLTTLNNLYQHNEQEVFYEPEIYNSEISGAERMIARLIYNHSPFYHGR